MGHPFLACPGFASSLQQHFTPGTRTTQVIFPITSTCQDLLSQFPRKTVLNWVCLGLFPYPDHLSPGVSTSLRYPVPPGTQGGQKAPGKVQVHTGSQ